MSRNVRPPEREWSHWVSDEDVGDRPLLLHIAADDAACARVASRIGVQDVRRLEAEVQLERLPGSEVIEVTGTLSADVVQTCVVTGDPVKSTISDDFEAWYADRREIPALARARVERDSRNKADLEIQMSDEREDPEPMENGQIDLGELVTQYLSLALDPFPQSPEIRAEAQGIAEKEAASRPENPFAALRDWKRGKDEA